MRPRQHGKTASLVQIAAAIVGSAAATQVVVSTCCPDHDPDAEAIQCCDDCPNDFEDPESLDAGREAARVERLDVHAALNTYEVAPDVPEGVAEEPSTLVIVGANHRRLIVRWTDEGVWIGGCLVTDEAVADRLAAFITREDETQ